MPSQRVGASFATAVLALLAWLAGSAALADPPDNLAINGGFEKGENGWQWQQWDGRRLPGHIDRDDAHEGLASFKFHEAGVSQELYMAIETKVAAGRDYLFSIALKPQQMPEGAARVRVLVDGRGWYGSQTGQIELVQTGGTHDWKSYAVSIAASALGNVTKLTIFVYHAQPGRGTLGIDAVSMKPAAASGTGLKSLTFTSGNPAVLVESSQAQVAIQAVPDRVLYRVGELPRLTVRTAGVAGTTLAWRIVDGFGNVLQQSTGGAGAVTNVPLPPGHGYYEVIATVSKDGQTLGEARRSIGALPPPPRPTGDEPFGLWIQGEKHYPELGVRWLRDGIYWDAYRAHGDAYLQERLKLYKAYRSQGIRIIAYPKGHPNETSREVIADTPQAWRALEDWWTKMVQATAGHVDAWGVVNEPMRGHWEGSDELIMRYWGLMRRIVTRYDPRTPLIGPSLSPTSPQLVEQYTDLLGMGFGRLVDAIEMHTYVTSPEDNDWEGSTQRIRQLTRSATGRDLQVWSTEHGSSATYDSELLQAQHLMRSWLEAKKIGYPVMIWHMFSHPQGTDVREVQFGIFRNTRQEDGAPPQPRPAGVAYGVMTRQLAGATYKASADYFGPSVRAYVFERDGKAMMALWTTSPKTYDVVLPAGDETKVTSTGLFGKVAPLSIRDGMIRVAVDRNPQFIAPLPAHFLRSEPIARVDEPIAVLPGAKIQTSLTVVNPTAEPARFRIQWLSSEGWDLKLDAAEWSLNGHERKRVPLTVSASSRLAIGSYQLYARILRNDVPAASLAAPAAVQPQAMIAGVAPRSVDGRPTLAGTLRRFDRRLGKATVRLDRDGPATTVTFDGDEAAFAVPVTGAVPDRLRDFRLAVYGLEDKLQAEETVRASFIMARRAHQPPAIDGDLSDWPELAAGNTIGIGWRWDERNLYLAVRVADGKHVQDEAITEMWKGDSVQIGLAPGRPEQLVRAFLPGLQESDMVELDVALRRDGAAVYRHLTLNKHLAPAGAVDRTAIRRAARHGAGVTTYELQIPVEQIGLRPLAAEQMLRASLLINANDGNGRRTTEWFGGIKEAKDPNLFGHLLLQP